MRTHPLDGRRRLHSGIDLAGPRGGMVQAAARGFVVRAGWMGGYGLTVEIRHPGDVTTRYAHLQRSLVQKGQRVTRGDVIGRVGSTGRSTFSHLHYEIEQEGERIDPLRFVLAD